MQALLPESIAFTEVQFAECLRQSSTYAESIARQQYIDASMLRLYRILRNMLASNAQAEFSGPTLDVASGWGIMFPALRKFLPKTMPYSIAEMGGWNTQIDGVAIAGCKFECEKDVLEFPDSTFGLVCFFDCIEHLIVDPLWPLLEFNRVLRIGGQIAINTPNASAVFRIFRILHGENPATESTIKPNAIYQRHNREWTLKELTLALKCCGFDHVRYSTNYYSLDELENAFLRRASQDGWITEPLDHFGPELFLVADKVAHVTLNSNRLYRE